MLQQRFQSGIGLCRQGRFLVSVFQALYLNSATPLSFAPSARSTCVAASACSNYYASRNHQLKNRCYSSRVGDNKYSLDHKGSIPDEVEECISKRKLAEKKLLRTPMKPVKKRIIQNLFLHPKRQRFVVSKNLDDELLQDEEFVNEYKSLKHDGTFVLAPKDPKKVPLTRKERKQRLVEKLLKDIRKNENAWKKKDLEGDYDTSHASTDISNPKLNSSMQTDSVSKSRKIQTIENEVDSEAAMQASEEALHELKARMQKLKNKKLRRELRQENDFLIRNKLVTTKELIREKIKAQELAKKQQMRAEEKQQAQRLGLASGSLNDVRKYMQEKNEEAVSERRRNRYTERDSEGIARYQHDFATRVHEALQAVLEKENKNRNLEQVLINHVRVDSSLRYVNVLWDFKYEENRKTLQRAHTNDLLQQASGFLGSKVGNRLQCKYAPKFTFYYLEDFNKDVRFHSIYDTFDQLGFKTTMEERMQEHNISPLFNPQNSSPQVVTKSQKVKSVYEKRKRHQELGRSKWLNRGRF